MVSMFNKYVRGELSRENVSLLYEQGDRFDGDRTDAIGVMGLVDRGQVRIVEAALLLGMSDRRCGGYGRRSDRRAPWDRSTRESGVTPIDEWLRRSASRLCRRQE